mgnify:CR=1 FL=1
MRNFKELKVWQKSHNLALSIYKATAIFPKEEVYGMTSQIRRACSSISANIAEGCGRGSEAEFAQFLQIAMGSASELESHLLLAHDLGFLKPDKYKQMESETTEIKRMLTVFIKKLRTDS